MVSLSRHASGASSCDAARNGMRAMVRLDPHRWHEGSLLAAESTGPPLGLTHAMRASTVGCPSVFAGRAGFCTGRFCGTRFGSYICVDPTPVGGYVLCSHTAGAGS